ncbi:MAG: 30S ribosomal protein S15 [Nitrososphaeraceae archaeon]
MARIHAHTHGKSHSTRPVSFSAPSWITQKSELSTIIVQLSKDGLSPSEIGIKMRDQYGVPLIKPILGKGINQLLEENNSTPEMPEDLNQLVQKALALQKHLKVHNTDKRNIRSLELIEAKIHRLSRYYKRKGKISQNWKYAAVIARLE